MHKFSCCRLRLELDHRPGVGWNMATTLLRPRLVIVDQDGVLIQENDRDIAGPQDVRLIPGAAEAIARCNRAGIKVAVCSNQDAVGRGQVSLAALGQIEARLREQLAARDAHLDAVFYCTDNPASPTRRHKPGCGMLDDALKKFDEHAADVPVIGDQLEDLVAAATVGCPRHLVMTGQGARTAHNLPRAVRPVEIHENIGAAVRLIVGRRIPLSAI
jgi:D-glycero-D-manno-heptose 1,7-bisphosphate phosphatase